MNKSSFIKFFSPSHKNRLLLIEASLYTIWALIIIHIFSFKRYLNWISNSKEDRLAEQEVKDVFYAIRKIDKHAFWKTTCYTQAISARLLLKRKGIKSKIYLGMTKDNDNKLLAHAWTKVGEKVITGGGNLDKYKVLYIFE